MSRPLARPFYGRDSRAVAPELLNKLLVHQDGRVARLVEVEAYCGGEDPASHGYRGKTARNRTMFGPPGHLYVYLSYGMHWCANAVCGVEGESSAVLLRAAAPVAGHEAMYAARGPAARRDRDLASGPGKLGQAFGMDRSTDGADLVTGGGGLTIVDDGTPPPSDPVVTTRVGISVAVDDPWRWYVRDDPNVSRR